MPVVRSAGTRACIHNVPCRSLKTLLLAATSPDTGTDTAPDHTGSLQASFDAAAVLQSLNNGLFYPGDLHPMQDSPPITVNVCTKNGRH